MAPTNANKNHEDYESDITPDIPGLRTREGVSDPHSNSDGNELAQKAMGGKGGQDDSKSAFGTPPSPAELEASMGLTSGGLWNAKDLATTRGRAKVAVRVFKKHRKGLGGTAAAVAILLAGFALTSGPFQFIHIAQLLERDFASQEDAQDNRLTKIAQYIRDPSKPQNARVGVLGTEVATRVEKTMHEKTGLTPAFEKGGLGLGSGYTVDPKHPKYAGKNTAEIKKSILAEYSKRGLKAGDIRISANSNGKQLIQINTQQLGKGTISRYRAQTAMSRDVMRQAGYSRVTSYAGTRVEAKRAGWSFHPIQQADQRIKNNAIKGGKAAYDKYKEQRQKDFLKKQVALVTRGVQPVSISAEDKTAKDKDGKSIDPVGAQDAKDLKANSGSVSAGAADAATSMGDGVDKTKEFSKTLGDRAKAGGAGAVGVAGLLCILNGLSQHIDSDKYTKAILPMMRMAGLAKSIGSQSQSNQDISNDDLKEHSQFLTEKDKNGKVTSTLLQARSFQADLGQPQTGPDIPKAGQVFEGNPVDFISDVPGLKTVCGVLNSTAGQIVMFAAGPINFIVTGEIIKLATGLAAGWLSGSPVSPLAAGAERGNYVKYGNKLLAGDTYASVAGVPMDAQSAGILDDMNKSFSKQEFESKSVAYRIFNPRDQRTLVSRVIDRQVDSGVAQNVASMASNFSSIFSSAVKVPATLATSVTHAAEKPYKYHGMKTVGFTPDELGDPRFDNPYLNACYVVGCHDARRNITGTFENQDKADKYIDRASKCFGINITGDSSMWSIDAKTEAVNMYSKDFPEGECRDSSLEWKQVRFWLLDSGTMEGYNCVTGDIKPSAVESCAALGFEDGPSSASSSEATAEGNVPSGDTQELAKQLIDSGKLTDEDGRYMAQIKAVARGDDSCPINQSILQMLVGVVVQDGHTVVISSLNRQCTNVLTKSGVGSFHYRDGGGHAVDVTKLDGNVVDGRKNPGTIKFLESASKYLPSKTGYGQDTCGSGFKYPAGSYHFFDTCNHQHIQVPVIKS